MTGELVSAALGGERLSLARLLSQVENDTAEGRAALTSLFPRTGRAHLIGITGSPGTGKSTLVNRLAQHFRTDPQRRVAIVAVDPSSPFTGGALLGDRVRMRDLSGDAGVFIRSMSSRGSLGGLAQQTAAVAHVFDAAGYDIVMIETVGAGQGEVDIARLAHTTVVVEAPGLGDDIQAIKAGILEIADILVVNKADRPGVENTEKALRAMLELSGPARVMQHHGKRMAVAAPAETSPEVWVPPIQRTVATDGSGVFDLARHIERHAEHLRKSGAWSARERARLEAELQALIQRSLMKRFRERIPDVDYDRVVGRVFEHTLSPWEAAERLIEGEAP